MKTIAVDAMGGDNAPKAIVEGVNRFVARKKRQWCLVRRLLERKKRTL